MGGEREVEGKTVFGLYHMRIKSIFNKKKKSQKQCGKAGKYLMFDINTSQGQSLVPQMAHAIR